MKCYCVSCNTETHSKGRKQVHRVNRIASGRPYKVNTITNGDARSYPKKFDWVTIHYKMFVKGKGGPHTHHDEHYIPIKTPFQKIKNLFPQSASGKRLARYGKVIESSNETKTISGKANKKKPLMFQSGCSGPSLHLQVLNCKGLKALDDNGVSDPYVSVWWGDTLVGTTRIIYKTLNPSWENETFVIPLDKSFMEIYNKMESSKVVVRKSTSSHHKKGGSSKFDPNEKLYKTGDFLSVEEAEEIVEELNGNNYEGKIPKLRLGE